MSTPAWREWVNQLGRHKLTTSGTALERALKPSRRPNPRDACPGDLLPIPDGTIVRTSDAARVRRWIAAGTPLTCQNRAPALTTIPSTLRMTTAVAVTFFLSTTVPSSLVTVHPHEVLCIAVKTERRSIVALSVPHSLDVHRPGAVQSPPQHEGDDDGRSGDHGTQEQDALRDDRRRRQRHQSHENEPCRNDAHPSEQNRHTAHIRFVISISSRTSSATGAPTRRITSGSSQITSSNISASSSSPRSLWKGLLALPRSARPPTSVL